MTVYNEQTYKWAIGKVFGNLTVFELCRIKRKHGSIQGLRCKCACGNIYEGSYYGITAGTTASCGCLYRLQLIGNRYGKLIVTERITIGKNSNLFKCICDCGNEKIIEASELKRGHYKSCGCNRTPRITYEYREHPLYDVWKGMKARCRSKKHISSKNYVEKGVRVCEEWESSFISFYNWCINNGWEYGKEVDKDIIPEKLGIPALLYSPDMCSIVTSLENQRAKKSNKINMEIAREIRTSSLSRKELAIKYNVHPSTINKIKSNKSWKD